LTVHLRTETVNGSLENNLRARTSARQGSQTDLTSTWLVGQTLRHSEKVHSWAPSSENRF